MAASIQKQVLWRTLRLSRFSAVLRQSKLLSRRSNVRLYGTHIEAATPNVDLGGVDEEFRVLIIPGHTKLDLPDDKKRKDLKHGGRRREVPPPRSIGMKTDQDWTSVWPTAQSFKWSTVPLPIRQGTALGEENDGVPPKKYANAELMKIPNFLHLTPKHIRQHCAALRQFCTKWPEGLETEADCERHFPIEVIERDYLTDGPSLRDERARKVTVKIRLSVLGLDYHARDKLLRLVGDRYDPVTDVLTLDADRCPMKKQNYEYAIYLLTALYHESWDVAPWESEKTVADMEKYVWDLNPSKQSLLSTLQAIKTSKVAEDGNPVPAYISMLPVKVQEAENVDSIPEVREFKESVEEVHNEGESTYSWDRYKESVKRLLVKIT